MKTRFGFIDPGAIMGVVISLVILGVGVFAFFVVCDELSQQAPSANTSAWGNSLRNSVANVSTTGESVFNIIGIVLIIGAIMSIVGIVYNYVR